MTYIFYHHYERHSEDAKIIKTTTYDMIQQSVPEYTAEEKKLGCTWKNDQGVYAICSTIHTSKVQGQSTGLSLEKINN